MNNPNAGNSNDESDTFPRLIVIGVGNRFRQDDAVGLIVAQRLRALAPPSVNVIEHEGDPLDLLPVWERSELAILVDALKAPDSVGEIRQFDPDADLPPDRETIISSHAHSLWDALELASLMRQRPGRALVFAVSGQQFGYGEELSPEVWRAIDTILPSILSMLSTYA